MPLLDDSLIPLLVYEKVFKAGYRGTFLGGCIERKEGSNIRRSGHCHCIGKAHKDYVKKYEKNPTKYFPPKDFGGYICIKSRKPETCVKEGKLTPLFKHELAHLLHMSRGGNGYGKGFKECCNELGLYRYGHKVT